ncbi:MAG: class I tRNA ligase family protein, partial [Gemmatimonadaceae bacterium]
PPAASSLADDTRVRAMRQETHRTIAEVTRCLDTFRFNSAVARIRELSNVIEDFKELGPIAVRARHEALETLCMLIAPMMPHLAEALWHQLGHNTLLADERWPQADPALVAEEHVTIAVQVNGKLRGTLELPRDSEEAAAESAALALPAVARHLDGRAPRKVIIVPNRIVNVVV